MRFHRLRCLDCLVVAFAIAGIFCETFFFENLRRRLGDKIIPNFKNLQSESYAHPAPLPTPPPDVALAAVQIPYKNIIQGIRRKGDVRVFEKDFNYGRASTGHSITMRAEVECSLTSLTAESTDAIPILLRGGVGHDHFTVVVRAEAGRRLKGRVRAYCRKGQGSRMPRLPSFDIPFFREPITRPTRRTTTDSDTSSSSE